MPIETIFAPAKLPNFGFLVVNFYSRVSAPPSLRVYELFFILNLASVETELLSKVLVLYYDNSVQLLYYL